MVGGCGYCGGVEAYPRFLVRGHVVLQDITLMAVAIYLRAMNFLLASKLQLGQSLNIGFLYAQSFNP